jgi:hypothetical protein
VNDSRLSRQCGERDSRLGCGEIENSVRSHDGCESVAADWDTHLAAAGEQSRVLADGNRSRLLDRPREVGARRLPNDFDEDAAHASGRSGNDEPHIAHGRSPANHSYPVYIPPRPQGKARAKETAPAFLSPNCASGANHGHRAVMAIF